MELTLQESKMVLEMIESSNISGKAIEMFTDLKVKVTTFIKSQPEVSQAKSETED